MGEFRQRWLEIKKLLNGAPTQPFTEAVPIGG